MTTDETINLNHNTAECIRSATKFGEDVYYNICTGSVNHVPWGGVDWMLAVFGFLFIAMFILLMLGMLFAILD